MILQDGIPTSRSHLRWCRLPFLTILLLAISGAVTAARGDATVKDVYCGPRCVQHVLQYYGKDEDLLNLVRAMQWPISLDGTNIEQLGSALEAQGIHTRFIKVPKDAEFQWPHPAIFHLKLDDVSHFSVWLPPESPGEVPRLWSASFDTVMRADEFLESRTGAVLLTSDSTIPERPIVGVTPGGAPSLSWLLPIAAIAFAGGFYLAPALRDRFSSAKD